MNLGTKRNSPRGQSDEFNTVGGTVRQCVPDSECVRGV